MNSVLDAIQAWSERSHRRVWMEAATSSTNEIAKSISGYEAYATAHQTAGRGRFERSWTDVGQGQLLISFRKETKKSPSPFLAPRVGLSLAKAAAGTWPSNDWSLKVPNDLFLGNNKVAGLLLEAIQQGPNTLIIVGLGMNISAKPSLPLAGALNEHFPANVMPISSVCDFLDRFYLELNIAFDQLDSGLSASELSFLEVLVQKNPVTPRVQTIQADGTLVYQGGQTKKWMDL